MSTVRQEKAESQPARDGEERLSHRRRREVSERHAEVQAEKVVQQKCAEAQRGEKTEQKT